MVFGMPCEKYEPATWGATWGLGSMTSTWQYDSEIWHYDSVSWPTISRCFDGTCAPQHPRFGVALERVTHVDRHLTEVVTHMDKHLRGLPADLAV